MIGVMGEKASKHNAVLIIGNGFDLNCGLKTHYTDVYNEYVKTPSDNEVISNFKKMISSDYRRWADFEMGMADNINEFANEVEFTICANDFNGFMNNYLQKIQRDFFDKLENIHSYMKISEEWSNSFNNIGHGVTHNLDNMLKERNTQTHFNYSIITLNYTEAFDRLFDIWLRDINHTTPIHIHGILKDDPVLGVDNEKQVKASFDITNKFRRCFIKPYFNEVFDSSRVNDANVAIDSADTIFVYGASLGESDLSWREKLVSWMQSDKTHHLFIYDYDNSSKRFNAVPERLDYEEESKNKLFALWGLDTSNEIFNQVHLPCGINLFNFKAAVDADEALRKEKLETIKRINAIPTPGQLKI